MLLLLTCTAHLTLTVYPFVKLYFHSACSCRVCVHLYEDVHACVYVVTVSLEKNDTNVWRLLVDIFSVRHHIMESLWRRAVYQSSALKGTGGHENTCRRLIENGWKTWKQVGMRNDVFRARRRKYVSAWLFLHMLAMFLLVLMHSAS